VKLSDLAVFLGNDSQKLFIRGLGHCGDSRCGSNLNFAERQRPFLRPTGPINMSRNRQVTKKKEKKR